MAVDWMNIGAGAKPAPRNALAAGLSSGVDDLQGLGYSAIGAAADAIGAPGVRDWANERADTNQYESRINGRPDLEQIEDVYDKPSKWLPYLGYQVAKQVPNLATSVAAGLAMPEVAVPAMLSRGAAWVPKVLGGGGMAAARGEGLDAVAGAVNAGRGLAKQVMGGAAVNYGQGVGSLYQESVEGGDPNSGGKALLGGVPYALAETAPEAMLLGRVARGSGFSGNLLSRMGKAAGTQAATGATSELLQNEMEMAYNGHVTDDQAFSQRLNSGVAGGLVEGLMGSAGGVRSRRGLQLPTDAEGQQDLLKAPAEAPDSGLGQSLTGSDFSQLMGGRPDPLRNAIQDLPIEPGQEQPGASVTGMDMSKRLGGSGYQFRGGEASPVEDAITNTPPPSPRAAPTPQEQLQQQAKQVSDQVLQARQEHVQAANERGITEDKGIDLHGRLKAEHTDGFLDAHEFANLEGMLRTNRKADQGRVESYLNGKAELQKAVEEKAITQEEAVTEMARLADPHKTNQDAQVIKFIEGKRKAKEAVATAAAETQAKDVAAVQTKKTSAPVAPAAPVAKVATLKPKAAPVEAANAVATVEPTGTAIAGIDGSKQITVGRAGREKAVMVADLHKMIVNAPATDKRRIASVFGWDLTSHPDTGAPLLVQTGKPLSLAEVAEEEARVTGHKITKQAIDNTLKKYGIDQSVIDKVTASDGALNTVSEAELGIEPGAEDSGSMRIEQSASKATGQGLVKTAEGQTKASRDLDAQATAFLKANPENLPANAPAVDAETHDVLVEHNAIQKKKNDRAILESVESENAQADWDSQEVAWSDLPDYLRVDYVLEHRDITQGDNEYADAKLSTLQHNIVRMYDAHLDRQGQNRNSNKSSVPESNGGTQARLPGPLPESSQGVGSTDPAGEPVTSAQVNRNVAVQVKKKIDPAAVAEPAAPRKAGTLGKRTVAPAGDTQSQLSAIEQGLQALATDKETAGSIGVQVGGGIKYVSLADAVSAAKAAVALGVREVPFQIHNHTGIRIGDTDRVLRELGVGRVESGTGWAKDDAPGVQYSKGAATHGSDANAVISELKAFMGGALGRKVQVVQSLSELPAHVQKSVDTDAPSGKSVQGFVHQGRVYLIAGNIQPGQARAVFLHEVGSHLGLENILGKAEFERLAGKIQAWADKNDGSLESRIAKAALARVAEAGTSAEHTQSESVAYFIEEAINHGVDPTATKFNTDLGRWFRSVWAAFKTAVRKLGMNPDKLTAQDVVDMAYGAAKLESTGAWHGTAAEFRKFNHDYMGSGEGAQAYGWGSYFAQAPGIAKGYFRADVKAKTGDAPLYDGEKNPYSLTLAQTMDRERLTISQGLARLIADTRKRVLNPASSLSKRIAEKNLADLEAMDPDKWSMPKGPDGNMMRTDFNVNDDEWLDLDKPLDEQSAKVKAAAFKAMSDLGLSDSHATVPRLKTESIPRVGWLTGRKFYAALEDHLGNDKAASEYLDSIGIKGNKFLDANSRGEGGGTQNLVVFNDKNIQRVASLKGADREKVRFSIAPQVARAARTVAGPTGEMIARSTSGVVAKMARSLSFLHDLVDDIKTRIPAAEDWYKGIQDSTATRNKLEADAEKIASDAGSLKRGTQHVNDFIANSTSKQLWGYDHTDAEGKVTKADPEMRVAFNRLHPEEQAVVKAVFAHGDAMTKAKYQILKDLGMDKTDLVNMLGAGRLTGPYAPMKRFGNFVAVLKTNELVEAERLDNKPLVEALRRDPENYEVRHFDTRGQAEVYANDSKAKFPGAYAFEKSERVGEELPANFKVLEQVLAAMHADKGMPAETKAAVTQMVSDLYFQSIDEQHARTSALKRKNRAGFDQDMIRSFLSHARSEAGFLSNLKHGGQINDAFYEMKRQGEKDGHAHQDDFNVLAAHYAENLKYKETPWQDRLMAGTSAWQLATSVGYHVANFMQPAMVSVPRMAADFNDYMGAWRHMTAAYSLLKTTGVWGNIKLDGIKNVGLRETLQRASDMQLLDTGVMSDLTQFDATNTGVKVVDKASAKARGALHLLRQVSRVVETANRVASATAAYNMAMEKGKTHAEAQEYALRILETTQGDSSRVGSPLLLKKIPKVMAQYKKFQLMMVAMYAKAVKQAFLSSDPITRAIGQRMLAFKLFHTSVAAGVLGMPLMNAAAMIFSAFGSDDEPKDLERSMRGWIGDEFMANLLLHGPLSMVGLDMSAKLGEDKVFSIMPYGKWDFSGSKGLAQTAASLAGPAFSQVGKMLGGVDQFSQGDYYKGVEAVLPKGFSDAMKAFRIANEGYTLKNGDVMFRPDDMNGLALAFDALGLPTSGMKRMDWLRGQQYEIGKFYSDRSSAIMASYDKALKDGDSDGMATQREHWQELQAGKDQVRPYFNVKDPVLKHQPLTTLTNHYMRKRANEAKRQME